MMAASIPLRGANRRGVQSSLLAGRGRRGEGAVSGSFWAVTRLCRCYPPLDCPAIIPEPTAGISVGAWRSLAARIVRDDEVGGSNPLAPTIPTNRAPFHARSHPG